MASLFDAEIIAVGSELLTASKVDTNSLYLTDQLNALGVEVTAKAVVGDDRARLSEAVAGAVRRAGLVVLTGGLGPTEDDVTRDAVAAALGRGQRLDEEISAGIADRFARMGRAMAEINRRQAQVIDGAEALPNSRGTAPGQWISHEGGVVCLLPGPPGELKAMFTAECLPRLERLLPPQAIRTRFYRVAGMAESDLDALIAPVYAKYANPATTILAALGDLQVHLRARCATAEEAERLVAEVGEPMEALLGERLYSRDGSDLETTLVRLLVERGETLATAESMTGGLVAQRLTSVPGSSAAFVGGFVTYKEEAKVGLLGVDPEVLAAHSAVSERVARDMAVAAREQTGADHAISVTGYAGPDGGTDADPVGTAYLGFASKDGVVVHRVRFAGDRSRNRTLTAQSALDLLRRRLS